jgi:transglutaminase-like putative cysteine protease
LIETAAVRARRGNCVAFTNLFIAMARSRGLRSRPGIQPRVSG